MLQVILHRRFPFCQLRAFPSFSDNDSLRRPVPPRQRLRRGPSHKRRGAISFSFYNHIYALCHHSNAMITQFILFGGECYNGALQSLTPLLSSHTLSLQEPTPSSSTTYFAILPKRPGQLVAARSLLHKCGPESPAAYTRRPGVHVLQQCSGTTCTCSGASSRAAAKRSSTITGYSVTFYRIIFGRVTLSTSSETCGG
jgi:hypothetical protein